MICYPISSIICAINRLSARCKIAALALENCKSFNWIRPRGCIFLFILIWIPRIIFFTLDFSICWPFNCFRVRIIYLPKVIFLCFTKVSYHFLLTTIPFTFFSHPVFNGPFHVVRFNHFHVFSPFLPSKWRFKGSLCPIKLNTQLIWSHNVLVF